MSKKFLLPDLGEGLPDATIVEWYVKEGDVIKLDDNLVSMETAKAVVDVPSPVSGKVLKLAGGPGDIVVTALAVSIDTRLSSSLMVSPSLTYHSTMVASGRPSPRSGSRNFLLIGCPSYEWARARLAAATILSTLGRYFISRRNSGMWVS